MITRFYMPTKVMSGRDCIAAGAGIFKALGRKALIVTGAGSSKKNGSERDVKAALDSAGISYLVYDRVRSNPTVSCAYEGASVARENGVDFIVAIGGGSPMDAGKAIALLAAQDVGEEKLFSGAYESKALPVAVVPTTAGTGSDVTQYSVLVDERTRTKASIASDILFPKVAFLDAKYMDQLPAAITVNTAVDALSHAMEGMLSVKATHVSDALALESIRLIAGCVPELLKAVVSKSAAAIGPGTRERLLEASFLAGIVISHTGTTAVHAMGYPLTCLRDIDHGRANGLLMGEYLRLVGRERPELTGRIFGAMGLSGTDEFKELLKRLLGEKEDITPEEIRNYSTMAIKAGNIANCVVKPKEEDLIEIYTVSFAK